MPRTKRLQASNTYYHVMNRGLDRRMIALDERDHRVFQAGLREIVEKYQCYVYSYCLMGNHFHILIKTKLPNLSRLMRHFSHCYTQRLNIRYQTDGPIFRGRFKSVVVSSERYLAHLVRYIHLNPVKAGVCQNASDYLWSSARQFSTQQFESWCSGHKILEFLGGDSYYEYKNLMQSEDKMGIEHFFGRHRINPVLDEETLIRCGENAVKNRPKLPGT